MERKYLDYLPNYLSGPNILRHGQVIEAIDESVDQKFELLSYHDSLKRPLLIQREQTTDDECTVTVYCYARDGIRELLVMGDANEDIVFNDDTILTEYQFSFDLDSDVCTETVGGICNPHLLVVLSTIDGYSFVKAYPENDTPLGDSADHDEFLDMLGRLCNVPRLVYSEYDYSDRATSYPSYMAKSYVSVYDESGEFVEYDTDKIESCTEDDYYYRERLQYFIDNLNANSMPQLMLKVWNMYDTVIQTSVGNLICHMDVDYMDDKYMDNGRHAGAEFNHLSYYFRIPVDRYSNLGVLDLTELSNRVREYLPLTRQPLVRTSVTPVLSIVVDTLQDYTARISASLDNGTPLTYYPLTISVDGNVIHEQAHTNSEGIYELEIGSQGVHTVQVCSHEDAESELVCYSEELELLKSTLIEYSVVSAYWGLVELEFLVTHRSSETPLGGRVVDVTLDNTSSVGGGTSGSDGVVDALLDLSSPGWYNLHVDVPRNEEYHGTSLLIPAFEVLRHTQNAVLNKKTTDYGRKDIYLFIEDNETDERLTRRVFVTWKQDGHSVGFTKTGIADSETGMQVLPGGSTEDYLLPGEYVVQCECVGNDLYEPFEENISSLVVTTRPTYVDASYTDWQNGYGIINVEVSSP